MAPQERPERTIGGLAGKAVGKAREALGQASDSDEPEREAEVPAEPDRLANRVADEQRET